MRDSWSQHLRRSVRTCARGNPPLRLAHFLRFTTVIRRWLPFVMRSLALCIRSTPWKRAFATELLPPTYRNMRDEFAAAWPLLRPGGVLISDDIQGNSAFQELADKPDVSACAVVEEHGKRALFGLAVKHK